MSNCLQVTHINIPTCGALRWTSQCCALHGYRIPDAVRLTYIDTPHDCRDIYVGDLWTVGHEVVLEHVPSLPLSPSFHQ